VALYWAAGGRWAKQNQSGARGRIRSASAGMGGEISKRGVKMDENEQKMEPLEYEITVEQQRRFIEDADDVMTSMMDLLHKWVENQDVVMLNLFGFHVYNALTIAKDMLRKEGESVH